MEAALDQTAGGPDRLSSTHRIADYEKHARPCFWSGSTSSLNEHQRYPDISFGRTYVNLNPAR